MVKYDPDSRRGEATGMVDKRCILSIKGNSIDEKDPMDYAEAIDYKGLKDV